MNRYIISCCLLFACLVNGKQASYEPLDCIQLCKEVLLGRRIYHAFFCPRDNVKQILLGLIHTEKSFIYAALYQITDKDIVDALIAARKRGVRIEIITDKSCLASPYTKVPQLRRNKIPVAVFKGSGIMHNKFFLFGRTIYNKRLLWTGSANATTGGTTRNQENVVVLEHSKLFNQYFTYFKELRNKIQNKRMVVSDELERIELHYYNSFLAGFQAIEV